MQRSSYHLGLMRRRTWPVQEYFGPQFASRPEAWSEVISWLPRLIDQGQPRRYLMYGSGIVFTFHR